MLDIYRVVTASGLPNFRKARLHLPSNFIFNEWEAIAHSQAVREVRQYFRYGFAAGFEGPIYMPSFGNHASAINNPRDVKAYITTEIAEGAMLRPWCQTNPLLTLPKCNSTDRWIITDLSWPLARIISINSGIPTESFLGSYKKMHLPSAQDLCDLICTADKGCFLYSVDVAQAYLQLHGVIPYPGQVLPAHVFVVLHLEEAGKEGGWEQVPGPPTSIGTLTTSAAPPYHLVDV